MSSPEWARCVGALVRDDHHRVYVQHRAPDRPVLPGIWDIIGDYLKPGETQEEVLARALQEQVGWRLRHVEAVIGEWDWTYDGAARHETDYLVKVDGDLRAPRLDLRKHCAFAWIGPDEIQLLEHGWVNYDSRLHDIVAKAMRVRLTGRLRLEPIGIEHADDLWRLHQDETVAFGHGGQWTINMACDSASRYHQDWEKWGVGRWMAYERVTGEALGYGGLSPIDRWSVVLAKSVLRGGLSASRYATEITRTAVKYVSYMKNSGKTIALLTSQPKEL
jgi:8-oxo-dGTP pyrophosphatase MutT (NUDIX family)